MEKYKITPPQSRINKVVVVSGSKSYTNRALVMASLSVGKTKITGISESDDSIAMVNALRTLGVDIIQEGDNVIITGNSGNFKPFSGTINVGAAGTTMRFLTSLVSLIPGEIILDGSERMRERPIFELVDALRSLGVKIEYQGKEGCPPLKISGGNIKGGEVSMDGSFSSQYFTSLLMISPVLQDGLTINVKGKQISESYIDMTMDGMKRFGVAIENEDYKCYKVKSGQSFHTESYHVEGDASGATYFWGIAAVNGGKVRVENVNVNSAQGDVKFVDLLEKMGCRVTKNIEENWIEVEGTSNLKGIVCDMEQMPDTAQTLSVISAFAEGDTYITGLSTLRIKETDRISAVQKELEKMGINSDVGPDWIRIYGGKPTGAVIDTYKDHRMAMSFAIAGSRIYGMEIIDPGVVSKSMPDFWSIMNNIGIDHSSTN